MINAIGVGLKMGIRLMVAILLHSAMRLTGIMAVIQVRAARLHCTSPQKDSTNVDLVTL
jgi:hypothetical protein